MRKLAAVVALTLLAGCPRRAPIRPEPFDKGQKAAILSILAPPKITAWASPGATGPELDAAPILADLRPVLVEALSKNTHFALVPEAKVFAAKGYAAFVEPKEPAGYLSPPGYKALREEALYPKIAREVGAAMGLGLAVGLYYRAEDGAATVVLSVGAIDLDGRGVWKGGGTGVADRVIDVRTASARARAETYRDAARRALAQLEEGLTEQLAVERAQRRADR